MWNPDTYKDTDYGLGEGESFEPADSWEPESGAPLDKPHVMTLLGAIEPTELGVCLPHVHLLCDPVAVSEEEPDYRLDDSEAAEGEIESFVTMNGRSLVECSTRDYGRMIPQLVEIAGWVPVHLISVTGRHKHLHASRLANALDVDALTQEFVRDLTVGMDGTDARAGVIKIGTSLEQITDVEQTAIVAAARAHRLTGSPITTHTEDGTMAHEQLQLLSSGGVDLSRVVIGHLDRRVATLEELVSIAETGAFLQFDQIGKSESVTDQYRAEQIVQLVEAGFADQLLLSLDYGRKSLLLAYDGSPGLPYLAEWFMVLLMENGLDAMTVRKIVVDNAARAMSVIPPTMSSSR